MQNEFKFFKFGLILLLLIMPQITLATSEAITETPYHVTLYCNINNSIESDLCESNNCSPKVKAYYSKGYNVDNIAIDKRDGGWWRIGFDSASGRYNFTDAAGNLLKKACKQDITVILDYIRQNNLPKTHCVFYPNATKVEGDGKQVGDWYLECSGSSETGAIGPINYMKGLLSTSPLLVPVALIPIALILFILFLIFLPVSLPVLAGTTLLSIYLGKKLKINKFYLLPILLGFIGGIIGYSVSPDKKIRKKLLIAGLIISLICFLALYLISGLLYF